MSSELPQIPPDELEPSLTALLLCELPHEQAAALHQRLAQDPELARVYERLKHTLVLVRETVASPAAPTLVQPAPLKLSPERRRALFQEFKTVRPTEFARPRTSRLLLAVAAGLVIIGLLASLLLPALSRGKYQGRSIELVNLAPSASAPAPLSRSADESTAANLEPPAAQPAPERGALFEQLRERNSSVTKRVNGLVQSPAKARAPSVVASPAPVVNYGIVLPSTSDGSEASGPAGAKDVTVSPPPMPPRTAPLTAGDMTFQSAQGVTAGSSHGMPKAGVLSPATPVPGTKGLQGVSNFAFQQAIQPPTTAKPTSAVDGDKRSVTLLGDVPMLGRLFSSEQGQGTALRQPAAPAGEPPPQAATDQSGYLAFAPEVSTLSGRAAWQGHGHYKQGNVGMVGDGVVGFAPGPVQPARPSATNTMAYYDTSADWKFGTGNANRPPYLGMTTNYMTTAGQTEEGKAFGLATASPNEPSDQLRAADLKTRIEGFRFSPPPASEARAAGILDSLQANVQSTRKSLSELDREVEQPTKEDLERAAGSRPYFAAKHKLDELTRSAQQLTVKLAEEKTDLQLPKSATVEVVEKAVPGGKPSLWEGIRGGFGGSVERSARVRVERDQTDIPGMQAAGKASSYDPYFVQAEFETIRSEQVLGKVVDELKLDKEWAKQGGSGTNLSRQEALRRLRGKLEVSPVGNTGLVNIAAKDDRPEEAAKLANAVAEAYQQYREEQRQRATTAGVAALQHAWVVQNQQLHEAQAEVDRFRSLAAPSNAPAATPQEQEPDAAKPTRPKPSAAAPIPQPEVMSCDNAFSTFSLNVSDVSFKLAAASLEKGALPDPAGIRSEEFINAFDYRDPEAPAGVPVAFAWERAGYPFAQNRDLLRFSLKTAAAGRQAGRPMNIVLLLDNSGSMERADRVRIIQEALRVLALQLQSQDKFSVVTFARTARLRVDGIPGNQAPQAAQEVAGLTPEGGTNLEDAMNLAYQTALRHYLPGGINRVVLLTDGAANLGDVEPDFLRQQVEANRKQGIALDCFGIGWEGYNDDLLEVLSRNGDGRYGFINTPEEAATGFAAQLAGALQVAAADVKVQVEFNPKRVTAYRQIGYARHQLTKEQFRDNTVDAAELGAAESGNALYVIAANAQGEGPLATVRIRYKVPGTTDYREQEWAVPYTGTAAPLDQATPALRLAASASAFSEWLAASPYAAEVTPERLLTLLSGVPESYGADPRPKEFEWMLRQAQSLTGK